MQRKATTAKLVKETKRAQTAYVQLPLDTAIDVVAEATDGKTYIFELSFGQWLKINKKPGVRYSAYQKGFAQIPGAIRTTYNN